ncbi:MAG: GNAT family N-acetyltransferase, partial [Firmicutes bacterium]|nr:GNAT family N-acetyltransferase [Bacillota bacterium]
NHVSLKKANLKIRNLTRNDMKTLEVWLNQEEILEFYQGRDCKYDIRAIERHYYNDNNLCRLILMMDGEPIGYMQYYPLTKAELTKYHFGIESKVFGLDLFIGIPELLGKGYGSKYIMMICDYLIHEQEVNKVVVDPMTHNKRAIRCYEKCGFEKQQLLPRHQLHEGVYQDCYLMVYDGSIKPVEAKKVEEPVVIETQEPKISDEPKKQKQPQKTTKKAPKVSTNQKQTGKKVTPKKKDTPKKVKEVVKKDTKKATPKKPETKSKPKTTKQTTKKNNL